MKCNNAPRCKACAVDAAVCTQCSDRFYSSGAECLPCADNCQTCTSATSCTTFKENSRQVAIFIDGVAKSTVCDPGCIKCSPTNPLICISCDNGYSLSTSGVCVACASKCKTCGTSPTACTSCYANAFYLLGDCLLCDTNSNCQTCLSSNRATCVTCPYKHTLSGGVCRPINCSLNCLACTNSTTCTFCKLGYSLSSQNTCLPCASNCRLCSSKANGICLGCGNNFYLSSASICTACPKNCSTCTELGCTSCQAGYFLNSTS